MAAACLTGEWRGYYLQGGSRHPIRMTVVQKGHAFVGQMHDEQTLALGEVEVEAGSGDQRTAIAVEAVSELPERSVVEGQVEGRQVHFTKRYLGTHRIAWWLRGRQVGKVEIADHVVQYRGELSADRQELRGEWCIPPREAGQSEARDGFCLVRQLEPPAPGV